MVGVRVNVGVRDGVRVRVGERVRVGVVVRVGVRVTVEVSSCGCRVGVVAPVSEKSSRYTAPSSFVNNTRVRTSAVFAGRVHDSDTSSQPFVTCVKGRRRVSMTPRFEFRAWSSMAPAIDRGANAWTLTQPLRETGSKGAAGVSCWI
jgi:hypothetical protein